MKVKEKNDKKNDYIWTASKILIKEVWKRN